MNYCEMWASAYQRIINKFLVLLILLTAPAQFARYQGGNNEPLWYHCCRVLEDLQYQELADETLDELGQFFEDLGDTGLCPSDYDVSLAVSLYGLHSKGLHLANACTYSIRLM